MEEEKFVENIIEETTKSSKLGTGLVITVGTIVIGAITYGGIKLYKRIKNKDNIVFEEETETETEE